jgi:hypothetical protein
MRGSFKSKRLTRFFRTQIPKNDMMIILAITLLHLKVPLITLLTPQLSVWNEKQNLREFAKKSTAKLSRKSKRGTIRNSRLRSNPGGWSLRKSTFASSSVSSNRRCGSK